MITLENQVSSLAPSKRLKEFGVKQGSVWYWAKERMRGGGYSESHAIWLKTDIDGASEIYSAFTVAELGQMLPFSFTMNGKDCCWEVYKDDKGGWEAWVEQFDGNGHSFPTNKSVSMTEADARAKMLIYLLENKLINIA